MKLELFNSDGGLLDTIHDADKITAFEVALHAWAENLANGDTIKVSEVKDDE